MSQREGDALEALSLEWSESTKLSKLLKADERLLDFIIALDPHDFERLRNPLMRKIMPPRITLGRIAVMTGRTPSELLAEIDAFLGLKRARQSLKSARTLPESPREKPTWAKGDVTRIIDLLESDERLDADPMLPINEALREMPAGELVLIKHKWEPQPLYDVWEKLGIAFYAESKSANEVWIYILKVIDED